MLILSRDKRKAAIMIGKNIKVTVLGIDGGKVSLGIDAPSDVEVHREEIFIKINQIKSRNPSNDCFMREKVK